MLCRLPTPKSTQNHTGKFEICVTLFCFSVANFTSTTWRLPMQLPQAPSPAQLAGKGKPKHHWLVVLCCSKKMPQPRLKLPPPLSQAPRLQPLLSQTSPPQVSVPHVVLEWGSPMALWAVVRLHQQGLDQHTHWHSQFLGAPVSRSAQQYSHAQPLQQRPVHSAWVPWRQHAGT